MKITIKEINNIMWPCQKSEVEKLKFSFIASLNIYVNHSLCYNILKYYLLRPYSNALNNQSWVQVSSIVVLLYFIQLQ